MPVKKKTPIIEPKKIAKIFMYAVAEKDWREDNSINNMSTYDSIEEAKEDIDWDENVILRFQIVSEIRVKQETTETPIM